MCILILWQYMALIQVYTLAAGKCQIWEALGKEGTKVAPEFVSHVAFATASLKRHPVQLRWEQITAFSGMHLAGLSALCISPLLCCRSARNSKYLRKKPHASPLVFTLCHCALIQGGSH